MKRLMFTILFCTIVISAKSQMILASAGDNFTNSEGVITWTIGEVITETFTNGNFVLTQGMQQKPHNVTETYVFSESMVKVIISPNPAKYTLNIKNNSNTNLLASVYDMNSRIVISKKLTSNSENIDISNLKPGLYMVKITGKSHYSVHKLVIEQ